MQETRRSETLVGLDGEPLEVYIQKPPTLVEFVVYETIGIVDPYPHRRASGMGTQGLVTLAREGKSVLKFLTGSGGDEASELRDQLAQFMRRERRLPTIEEGLQLGKFVGFGGRSSLVVMDAERCLCVDESEEPEDVHRRYLENGPFENPEFNHRWDLGTAAYVEVLEVDDWLKPQEKA